MGGARQREVEEDRGGPATPRRPAPASSPAAAAGMLELQRAAGNRRAYRAVVQRQLQVGPAGDPFEREADRVADEVMRALSGPEVTTPDEPRVRRSALDGAVGLEGGPLGADTESSINQARGSGSRLPDALRTSMERSFGADFSGVRVHTGPSADELNRSMQARAFTVGRDIFFARNQYQPQTSSGQHLLAHELAHTLQQGGVRRKNVFWGEQRSSVKENPLFTIARGLQAVAGVDPGTTIAHWRKDTSLAVAKTAKTALTSGPMAQITRPESRSAWLDTPNPKPGTRKDPAWITAYGNLGTVEDQIVGDTPQKYNGGHLIAWEFLNEDANVPGNIAPQAMLQNQALFRRIERTLEETVTKGGTGVEVTVTTPYRHDNTAVTYRQLFDRNVLTSAGIRAAVESANALDQSLSIAQMAPDTYDLYLLTQTGTTHPATADAREEREGVKTFALEGYTDAVANRVILAQKPPPLSILATNVDPSNLQQVAVAFAHVVYLNYRTTASPIEEEVRSPLEDPELEKRRLRAFEVIRDNQHLAVPILMQLTFEGLSPTEAESALILALMESEPPKPEPMETM